MTVFCFVTQKGGSGKTTLALNCAVAGMMKKKRVVIFDMDTQGTAENWYQDRDNDEPLLIRVKSGELEEALEKARKNNFDYVLIDTPGRDEPATAAAIKLADFCIIPCRPSPADMKATPATIETVRRLERPAAFVLNQTPPRSYRIREAQNGLSVLGMVSPVFVVSRNAFQDAQGAGLGVMEFEPDGKAAIEIEKLWDWLTTKARKLTNGK